MSPTPSLDYDRDIFGERVIRSVTANTRQDGLDLLREAAAIPIKPHTVRCTRQTVRCRNLKPKAFKERRC